MEKSSVFYDQKDFNVRCEWGEHGVSALAPISDVVIIVDVLSFSTSVEIAVQRGAAVYPFRWKDERAADFAASLDAELADAQRTKGKYSLSPASLVIIEPGTRLVLPSPNGATLSLMVKPAVVLAGCLRNARAVAITAMKMGTTIAVIPAGERWKDDGSMRPAFEDLVGAGAIIAHLSKSRSPEAVASAAAFESVKADLPKYFSQCSSGRELIERGYAEDVHLASQLDVSEAVPILMSDAFVRA